jgi:electron transport complex protein RnfD
MLTLAAALLPALGLGVYQFGLEALALIGLGLAGSLGVEAAAALVARAPARLGDLHAATVGLILVALVPAGAPWWLVLTASSLAVAIGKLPFGPLGGSPVAPAAVGLMIAALSWPQDIARHVQPRSAPEALRAAPAESPLDAVRADPSDAAEYAPLRLFLGDQPGPLGASPLAALLGGLLLGWRRLIAWQAPLGFVIGLGAAAAAAHALAPEVYAPAAFHLFTGAALFAAVFLCTDFTSTPVTPRGMLWFGLLAGGLTFALRLSRLPFGHEAFAVASLSLATPLLDRLRPAPFGQGARHA